MSYTNVYPSRINWENEPSIASPINATNLNKLDYAAYEFDQTFATWDITKANQSDLLLSVKSIDYDTETGVFVFTWQNGTTKTVDLNIEKIPVSFSMSPQGVITMTTDDGTTYTADVGSLIKTYTFSDSTEIDFTVTTDASGNKTVTAALKDGSIVGTKLEPNYLANCQNAANSASGSATAADGSAEDSEAWAVGTRDGVPVPSTDPAYNNNSKYWATQGGANSLAGLSDTDINSPTDGQGLVYNYSTSKWINGNVSSGSTITVFTNESSLYGRTVTLTIGQLTKTETFSNVGVAVFKGIVSTGTFTITSSTSGGDTATTTLYAPYFGNYTKQLTLFNATVTVTFPYSEGASCTITDGVTTLTANTSPMAFNVPNVGTWTATCTIDNVSAPTQSAVITTDGQTETMTFTFGTINLTYDNAFRGSTITCASGGTTISKTAPISGNTMTFYPPSTGTWSVSGTYSGQTYSVDAEVTSLSTAVSVQLQTTQTVSVTIYSAVGDTITYTDIYSVSRMITLDNNSDHTTATIDILPSGSTLTFTSSIAKNPDDLTADYSKSVAITDATTEIKVMPDKSIYWYGWKDNAEECLSSNGWLPANYSMSTGVTFNTNSATISPSNNNAWAGVGSKNSVEITSFHMIAKPLTGFSDISCYMTSATTKSITGDNLETVEVPTADINVVKHYAKSLVSSHRYLTASGLKYQNQNRTLELYALWGE